MQAAEVQPKITTPRFYWVAPVLVLLVALGLRLYRLDWQSLWYDEIFAVTVSHLSWPAMHAELVKDIVHPPLHYYLLHLWMGLVGTGPAQARLLSVLFGTLSVGAIFALGRYLFDRRTAILSALLLAISQTGIHYSQEARPYAQLLLFTLCSSYLFIRALHSGRAAPWWLFVASTIPLVYTHYYSAFVFVAFLVFGFWTRRKYAIPAVRWMGGIAVLAAAVGVWMASGVLQAALRNHRVGLGPSSEHWYTILTVLNIFNNGRSNGFPNPAPWWSFPIGLVVFSLPATLPVTIAIRRKEPENSVFLLLLCGIPLLLALAMGLIVPFFDIRYVGFCAAPYYVLVARGLTLLNSRRAYTGAVFLTVAYSVYGLRANYLLPYKEDHRDALNYIAQHRQPRDCYVAVPPWQEREVRWAWSIYNRDLSELVTMPASSINSAGCGRIWLISVTYMDQPLSFQRSREAKALLAKDYSQVDRQSYFWVETGLYEPKRPDLGQR